MIAINQVLTQKSSNGDIVDESASNPEVPFANTLDELVKGSTEIIKSEEILLAELEADPTFEDVKAEELETEFLQENLLEILSEEEGQLGITNPVGPEKLPLIKQGDQLQDLDSTKQQTGLSRLEVLKQGKPLNDESILVPEQRIDIKDIEKDILAKQQTKLGENPLSEEILNGNKTRSKTSLNETLSAHPFSHLDDVLQKTQPIEDSNQKMQQMQAVLKQQYRSGNNENLQTDSQQEQILDAGLIKPGEQVQAVAARAPIESRLRVSSDQTKSTFSMKSSLEPVTGSDTRVTSNIFQTQLISKTEAATQNQAPVQTPDLPFDVEQIMSRVRVLRDNDSQQMTLRLQPEHLGQVTMKVRQNGGELQVDMRVDNMMAKQIIESGFDNLRSRFLDQELSYDQLSLNIEVDQRSTSQYDRDQQNSRFSGENASSERSESEEETIPGLTQSRSSINNNDNSLNIYV
jgi:flagellar hook-length control protein FliK